MNKNEKALKVPQAGCDRLTDPSEISALSKYMKRKKDALQDSITLEGNPTKTATSELKNDLKGLRGSVERLNTKKINSLERDASQRIIGKPGDVSSLGNQRVEAEGITEQQTNKLSGNLEKLGSSIEPELQAELEEVPGETKKTSLSDELLRTAGRKDKIALGDEVIGLEKNENRDPTLSTTSLKLKGLNDETGLGEGVEKIEENRRLRETELESDLERIRTNTEPPLEPNLEKVPGETKKTNLSDELLRLVEEGDEELKLETKATRIQKKRGDMEEQISLSGINLRPKGEEHNLEELRKDVEGVIGGKEDPELTTNLEILGEIKDPVLKSNVDGVIGETKKTSLSDELLRTAGRDERDTRLEDETEKIRYTEHEDPTLSKTSLGPGHIEELEGLVQDRENVIQKMWGSEVVGPKVETLGNEREKVFREGKLQEPELTTNLETLGEIRETENLETILEKLGIAEEIGFYELPESGTKEVEGDLKRDFKKLTPTLETLDGDVPDLILGTGLEKMKGTQEIEELEPTLQTLDISDNPELETGAERVNSGVLEVKLGTERENLSDVPVLDHLGNDEAEKKVGNTPELKHLNPTLETLEIEGEGVTKLMGKALTISVTPFEELPGNNEALDVIGEEKTPSIEGLKAEKVGGERKEVLLEGEEAVVVPSVSKDSPVLETLATIVPDYEEKTPELSSSPVEIGESEKPTVDSLPSHNQITIEGTQPELKALEKTAESVEGDLKNNFLELPVSTVPSLSVGDRIEKLEGEALDVEGEGKEIKTLPNDTLTLEAKTIEGLETDALRVPDVEKDPSLSEHRENLSDHRDIELEGHRENLTDERETELGTFRDNLTDNREVELGDRREGLTDDRENELEDHRENLTDDRETKLEDHREDLTDNRETKLSDFRDNLTDDRNTKLSDVREDLVDERENTLSDIRKDLITEDVEGLSDHREDLTDERENKLSDVRKDLTDDRENTLSDIREDLTDDRENELEDFLDTLTTEDVENLSDHREDLTDERENALSEIRKDLVDERETELSDVRKDLTTEDVEALSDYLEELTDDREFTLYDKVLKKETAEKINLGKNLIQDEPKVNEDGEEGPGGDDYLHTGWNEKLDKRSAITLTNIPEVDSLSDELLKSEKNDTNKINVGRVSDYENSKYAAGGVYTGTTWEKDTTDDKNHADFSGLGSIKVGVQPEGDKTNVRQYSDYENPDFKDDYTGNTWTEGEEGLTKLGSTKVKVGEEDGKINLGKNLVRDEEGSPGGDDYVHTGWNEKLDGREIAVEGSKTEEGATTFTVDKKNVSGDEVEPFNPSEDDLYTGNLGLEEHDKINVGPNLIKDEVKDGEEGPGGDDYVHTGWNEELDGRVIKHQVDQSTTSYDGSDEFINDLIEILESRNDLQLYYTNILKFAQNKNLKSGWGSKVAALMSAYLSADDPSEDRLKEFEKQLFKTIFVEYQKTPKKEESESQEVEKLGTDVRKLDQAGKKETSEISKGSVEGPGQEGRKDVVLKNESQYVTKYKLNWAWQSCLDMSQYLRWVAEKATFGSHGSLRAMLLDTTLMTLVATRNVAERLSGANRDRLPGGSNVLGSVVGMTQGNLVENAKAAARKIAKAGIKALNPDPNNLVDKTYPLNRPDDKWAKTTAFQSGNNRQSTTDASAADTGKGGKILKSIGKAIAGEVKGLLGIGAEGDYKFKDNYVSNAAIGVTLSELCGDKEIDSLEDLRTAIETSPVMASASKVTTTSFNNKNGKVTTLDDNSNWEIVFGPYIGESNGRVSYLPSIGEIDALNAQQFNLITSYGWWIPITSFELSKSKMVSKTLQLYNGEISYPVGMEYTNELRLTIADDQYKSWRRYFEMCSDCAIYNSTLHDSSYYGSIDDNGNFDLTMGGPNASRQTKIDKTFICPAPYKNITFRCLIYCMTPQKETINKYDLLVIMKDFSEERTGDIEAGGSDLTVSFSIVGEHPGNKGTKNDKVWFTENKMGKLKNDALEKIQDKAALAISIAQAGLMGATDGALDMI